MALTCPFHFTQQGTYLGVVSVKNREFSPHTMNIINGMYWGCYGISHGMCGIHFVYRYLASCGSDLVNTFKSWKILLWFLIPVISGGIWSFDSYVLFEPTQSTTDFVKENIFQTFGLKEDEFVYLGLRVYEKTQNNTYIFNIKHIIAISFNLSTVNTSLFTIFFFGIKCYYCIHKMVERRASSKTSALQKQLFNALVVQTLIPLLLMQIPLSLVTILCMFNISDEVLNGIAVVTICVYPAIDPLPNMFFIKDYRRAVIGYIRTITNFILCRKNRVGVFQDGSVYTAATSSAFTIRNSQDPRSTTFDGRSIAISTA